jgi:hypothetical protein
MDLDDTSKMAPSARRNGWVVHERANLGYGLGQQRPLYPILIIYRA